MLSTNRINIIHLWNNRNLFSLSLSNWDFDRLIIYRNHGALKINKFMRVFKLQVSCFFLFKMLLVCAVQDSPQRTDSDPDSILRESKDFIVQQLLRGSSRDNEVGDLQELRKAQQSQSWLLRIHWPKDFPTDSHSLDTL